MNAMNGVGTMNAMNGVGTMNTAPINPISTPSISSAAMLVEVSISTWTGRKLDKRASDDITQQNYAAKGVINANKKLLGNCAELDAVIKFASGVRNSNYSMTMPWSDTGPRLLPTAQYFKYHQQMTAFKAEFERLTQVFIAAYDWEITQAQAVLGDLFNPDDYPTVDSLHSKFAFRLNYIPLPDAGDFRIDINNEAKAELISHYQQYYEAQFNGAMTDVWQRTYKALNTLSKQCDWRDGDETRKRMHASVFDNAMDLVDLLKVCNITNDTQMEAMRAKLEDTLRGITCEALKDDEHLRMETKRELDQIIKSLPSLDM